MNDPNVYWQELLAVTPTGDQEKLKAAYALAVEIHKDQWRRTEPGKPRVPYIVHPLRVAKILADEWRHAELKVLATALLHDVLEDCPPARQKEIAQEIRQRAGNVVLEAVWTLTKPRLPAPCPEEIKARRDARYFTVLRSAPMWVRRIKCADRVDNLRDARAWGEPSFWEIYSSETIGWHLFLARETDPLAEAALFRALVEGERDIRGRTPVWADGHLIDPTAAALIPEQVARHNCVIGLAVRARTLVVGMQDPEDTRTLEAVQATTNKEIEPLRISKEALRDALAAGLYGKTAMA